MEKKEIEICNPIKVAGITIIPVARTTLSHWHGTRSATFLGSKKAIGIVVISPSSKRAFRTTGKEVPLEQLIREAPDLREIIETS